MIDIRHCDALDLLKSLPDSSIDAVITDPPYGLAGRVFEVTHKHYTAINEAWDYEAPLEWMSEVKRVIKPTGNIVCFGGRQSIYSFASEGLNLGWRLVNDVTWVKSDAPPCFTGRNMTETTERFLWFSPHGSKWTYNLEVAKSLNNGINFRDVWYFNIEHNDRIHPAQKPLELMRRIVILLSPENGLICDPFLGSGTTALAAHVTGRNFIGCDINSDYVELAKKRIANADPYQPTDKGNGIIQRSLFE